MSPVDLIRNYVHEHFEGEEAQRRIYAEHWLPMERVASCPGSTAEPSLNTNAACERAFAAALVALRGSDASGEGGETGSNCGEDTAADGLWVIFQGWWHSGEELAVNGAEERIRCFAAAVRRACADSR